MTNGINADDFILSVEQFIKALDAAKDATNPELELAIEKWANRVQRDARAILSRPKWMLSSSIAQKVIEYQTNKKIWAMVGFRLESYLARNYGTRNTPGFYGRYHEAGWAPDRRTVKVPAHFLREAKRQNKSSLESDVAASVAAIMETIKTIMAERRAVKRS